MSILDGKLTIEVATASGIEAVTKRELMRLGYQPSGAVNGRITFEGLYADALRANMFLRTAERVRIVLGRFTATTFDELFDGVMSLEWVQILPSDARVVVNAKSQRSRLFALSSIQSIAKKAIVTSMLRRYARFNEDGVLYSIEVSIFDDEAAVALDTTGEALHKRGYRTYLGEAPIRETLAAAMLELSVWNASRALADPFCGSGTIPIEAALMGLDIAPGMARKFACEKFAFAPKVRPVLQNEAEQRIKRDVRLHISGFDSDPEAIKLALRHADRAGVREAIHLQVGDMRNFSSRHSHGVIVTNPPYGERLMQEAELRALYADLGRVCASLDEWCVYVITSYRAFEKYFGRKADRVRKLYNSELECNFYQYLASPPAKKGDRQ